MSSITRKSLAVVSILALTLPGCSSSDDSTDIIDDGSTNIVDNGNLAGGTDIVNDVEVKEDSVALVQDPYYTYRDAEIRDQVYDRSLEFIDLDTDFDGFLSSSEYNGPALMFQELDKNADSLLSMEEAKYMMTFAQIPEGSFIMGSDAPINAFGMPTTDVIPSRQVQMDSFKFSSTEITNAQYALYLNSALGTGEIKVLLGNAGAPDSRVTHPVPAYVVDGGEGTKYAGKTFITLSPISGLSHRSAAPNPLLIPEHPINQSWIRYIPGINQFYVHPGFEDHPATYIKWYGAMAFAEHYGLSLPTEAEWEYVAKAGDNFEYATGTGMSGCDVANYACYNAAEDPNYIGTDTPDEFVGFPLKVGSYAANPYGVYDLAGSVWEWTLDWYRSDFYQYNLDNGIIRNPLSLEGVEPPTDGSVTGGPGQEFSHDARVTRGGSYNYHEPLTLTPYRFPVYPFLGNDHFGARVVLRSVGTVFNGTQ